MSFFYPLSLINLFNRAEVAYLLDISTADRQYFSVLYVLILALGLSRVGSIRKEDADRVVLSTYVPAIAVWIALIMFLSIDARHEEADSETNM